MVKSEIMLQRYAVMAALGNVLAASSELCAAARQTKADPSGVRNTAQRIGARLAQ